MSHSSYAIFIFLSLTVVSRCQNNYCNFLNCNHTLCVYPTNNPSTQCTNVLGIGLTDSEKQRILDAHNTFRQRVASGLEVRGNPGPQSAGNIPNLVWNDEIASIAQRWAEQCNPKTDICRRTSQYPYVNQNIANKDTNGDVLFELKILLNCGRIELSNLIEIQYSTSGLTDSLHPILKLFGQKLLALVVMLLSM